MPSQVPEAVKSAITMDFNGATISKAFVNEQGGYKIHLTPAEGETETVFATARIEWIENALKKQ